MDKLRAFLVGHGTKVLGFAQVTLGVLATSTDVFSHGALKVIIVASGLATAWRGFVNTANQNQP